ncbi:MAG: GNAT family N-acetyltransferase, partial [Jatrophihabitantaceae bacterium]
RYGDPDETPVEAGEFLTPHGIFLVGLLDAVPVATGAWRRFADEVGEIKRMYVVPSARGRGLARRMLAELESTAAAAGMRQVVLGTGEAQPEAVALYRYCGYAAVTGFGRYACAPDARFFGKDLPRADRTCERPAP